MRILVAMSGGVDSSVVAGRLRKAGHEVVGVTLQLYDHGAAAKRRGACCAGQDIYDARRVADHLDIPHYVIDAERRFADAVIADFADAYATGETPVPCVRCNQTVKFTDLAAIARALGAERLATGHYVRRVDGPDGPELHRAVDLGRDQSWFLCTTTREQLALCLFPLGEMANKAAVRAEAVRLGLPVAAKPDSQDLCFVAAGHYTGLVGQLRPDALTAGPIVDEAGAILGEHGGIARYTVGQAKRLGPVRLRDGRRPVVVALDHSRRRVIVGPAGSGQRRVRLREVSWLIPPPAEPVQCLAKLRGRETPVAATVRATASAAEVILQTPALAAPGQVCAIYQDTRVIGGGFIAPGDAAGDMAPMAGAVDGGSRELLSRTPLISDGGVAQR
jgi:tRNA-specific 2-thiouridylase